MSAVLRLDPDTLRRWGRKAEADGGDLAAVAPGLECAAPTSEHYGLCGSAMATHLAAVVREAAETVRNHGDRWSELGAAVREVADDVEHCDVQIASDFGALWRRS